MSRKHGKIEIATPDDVKEYAQAAPQTPAPEGGAEAAAAAESSPQAETPAPADPVQALRDEVEQWKDKCLRAKAEMHNFQRRSEQEKHDAIKYANVGFARGLLEVIDSMESVLDHAAKANQDDAVVQAVRMVCDNFQKVLRQHHVTKIEADGQPFNPAVHEAMMQQPSDKHDVVTVLQVLQQGYKLHDRVLRPAKVIVSKPAETPGEPAEGDAGESKE